MMSVTGNAFIKDDCTLRLEKPKNLMKKIKEMPVPLLRNLNEIVYRHILSLVKGLVFTEA